MSGTSALDAYQDAAARTTNPALDLPSQLLDAAAGLAEEAGEVLGQVRKHVMQQRPVDRDALVEELGDALWCIAMVARLLGVPLSEVAQRNQEKLRKRHPDGFTAGHQPGR